MSKLLVIPILLIILFTSIGCVGSPPPPTTTSTDYQPAVIVQSHEKADYLKIVSITSTVNPEAAVTLIAEATVWNFFLNYRFTWGKAG